MKLSTRTLKMMAVSMLVAGLSHAQSVKPILKGTIKVAAESKPIRAMLYSDGRSDYVSLSYDLMAKLYVGAVHISSDACFTYYNFAGVTKQGESLSLSTAQVKRDRNSKSVCILGYPQVNTRGI